MRRAFVFAALLAGCGPDAAVWVRVEAPFAVPVECDSLTVRARRVADSVVVFSANHDLAAGNVSFPVSFALSTSEDRDLGEGAIALEVKAKLKGQLAAPWATRTQAVNVTRGEWSLARVALCDCPP